jgi:hypothetical protein
MTEPTGDEILVKAKQLAASVDCIWAISPSLKLFQKHFARLNLKAQTESQRWLGCL